MSILFDDKNGIFNLSTPGTTYLFGLYSGKVLMHIYYGKKVESNFAIDDIYTYINRAVSPVFDGISDNDLPLEYPCYGSPDLRLPAFHARYADGSTVTKLEYKGHRIESGKPKLCGLPASYVENDSEADTLYLELVDSLTCLKVILMYTVYNDRDIITRSVKVVNEGSNNIEILRVMSMSLDIMQGREYDFVHLQGAWARERHIERCSVLNGGLYIDSKRGASSHHHNPFICLAGKNTTEHSGDAYGFGLVYSGNFVGGAEMNSEDYLRTYIGINDFNFCWVLEPGMDFQAPEVVMTYSSCGFNKMSQNFHNLIRKRLCRGKFRDSIRPVLINNWEATYFNFDEEKIVNIAKTAKELGVELMVLDDGWFGKRNGEAGSLGDWYVNTDKLPNGIEALANRIAEMDMHFGLWFEPETVSPDSDLYRAHPEWAIQVKGRKSSLSRNQLILDLSRNDVRDYIIKSVSDILKKTKICYVKWDMNRNMTELGSLMLPAEKQQEFSHRYMLGLYSVLETITTSFPDVLFEGCSGGGGRFDLGMFYYYPQFWVSDDTDAVERMYIQYGTSMLYPTTTMGAHVSAVPNHQVWRRTSIQTRGNVAMMGRFGYELDLAKLTDEEKEIVRQQIITYKKWGQIIHESDMYRIKSPFETNNFVVEFVSDNKKNVIVICAEILAKPNAEPERILLKGLDTKACYRELDTGKVYGGDILENIGIPIITKGDFASKIMFFEKID